MMPKISIIIPCRNIDDYTKECIRGCLKLDYDNFEIIVLPDDIGKYNIKDERIQIIKTGKIVPAEKRNLGMEKAKGEFYAFIDSDAYPEKDWLKNVAKYFKDEKVGIVGGPNLTPPESNFAEKVSGHVLANFLISGHASKRYKRGGKNSYVIELPSCNYIVRKEAASEYDSRFLTAEDTKFCFNAREKGFKILYAKDVVVWHHRRDSFKKHIKQMFVYGRDNLWLLKENFSGDKFYFFITMLGVLGFLGGIVLSIFYPLIRIIFLVVVGLYLLGILFTSFHENFKISLLVFVTSILTHFTHGIGSIYGLFSRQKKKFSDR